MGVDITIKLINSCGDVLIPDLYPGRCSEWFGNLQKEFPDNEYEYLPASWNFPTFADAETKEAYKEGTYYGFNCMKLTDYAAWYNTYKPHIQAGWATKYQAWLIKTKGLIPEYLPREINSADAAIMEFVEYTNPYCCDTRVIKTIKETLHTEIFSDDWYIIYYFDR